MAELNQVSPELPGGDSDDRAKKRKSHYPYDDPDYGQAYTYDPEFKGPTRKRGCTDVICLLLFLAFIGGWLFVGYFAYREGDIDKVIYPTDSRGRICGRGQFADKPFLLFFDLTKCLNPAVLALGCQTPQVCVEKCPDERYSGYADALNPTSVDFAVKEKMKPFCDTVDTDEDKWNRMTAEELIVERVCPAWVLPSQPVIGRCLPTIVDVSSGEGDPNATVFSKSETMEDQEIKEGTIESAVYALGLFLDVRGFGEKVFNDLSNSWWMIVVALSAAAILSFVWIVLMRWFAGIMVWTSIGLLCVLFGGLFSFTMYKYFDIKDRPSAKGNIFTVNITPDYGKDVLALSDTWLAFSIILGVFLLVILMILIALRRRILIAIELIEQASKSVSQIFSTLFFPVFPFVMHVVVVVFFAVVAVSLASAGEAEYRISYDLGDADHKTRDLVPIPCQSSCVNPDTGVSYKIEDRCEPERFKEACPNCEHVQCQFTLYKKEDEVSWMIWYNLFGLYWGMFFFSALSELVLAGTFASWYWTWEKKNLKFCPLGRAFTNAVFFHLGTVAFGSLIIAIIRMLRTILEYVEGKLKKFNNDLTRCLICVCKCCLWCLEKFMRFINRNAYIMCAVKGTNFCVSAKDAFSLLMRNILRVVVLNKIVDFLLFLGKVVIVAGVGCLAYFVFSGSIGAIKDDIPSLNYIQTPIVIIVIGSYFIASSFFGVYEMAVDTLFLCFLEDLERNDGSPERPYFMSRGLRKVVGKMQQFNDDRDD